MVQLEKLRGKLDNLLLLLLLLKGRHVNAEEKESLHIAHLTQERSKFGQGGQMPNPIDLHLLDAVQLNLFQDLHDIFHRHCKDGQLLTAEVNGSFSLLHPPEEVGKEVIQGHFLQAKLYVYLQGEPRDDGSWSSAQPLVPFLSLRTHVCWLQTTCSRSSGQYSADLAPVVCTAYKTED